MKISLNSTWSPEGKELRYDSYSKRYYFEYDLNMIRNNILSKISKLQKELNEKYEKRVA